MKKIFLFTKTTFHISNIGLILIYLYPGSIFGWIVYGDKQKQPQLTSDFLIFSSNHVYAFLLLSTLGYLSYEDPKLNYLFIYLFSISIFLELSHIIIPNRGFEFSDLFGNIMGVLITYFFYKIINFLNLKNENK